MEDVLQFLIIAGAIAFGIFRQVAKDKAKKSENKAPMPEPVYEEYKPESPTVLEIPQKQHVPAKQIMQKPLPKEGVRTTYTPISPPTKKMMPKETMENCNNDYSIHSAEEARRAIIWSEIIQRKY